MTVLNVANKVYLGASLVSGVYAGTRKVWGPTGRNLVAAFTPSGSGRQDWDGAVGIAFSINAPMTFNQIGVYVGTGTVLTAQRVRLFNMATGVDLGRATINLTGHPPGVFYYVPIPTVTLASTVDYCLWAETFPSNGYFWDSGLTTTVRNGVGWFGAYAGGGGTFDGSAVANGGAGFQFYGLDLDYR